MSRRRVSNYLRKIGFARFLDLRRKGRVLVIEQMIPVPGRYHGNAAAPGFSCDKCIPYLGSKADEGSIFDPGSAVVIVAKEVICKKSAQAVGADDVGLKPIDDTSNAVPALRTQIRINDPLHDHSRKPSTRIFSQVEWSETASRRWPEDTMPSRTPK